MLRRTIFLLSLILLISSMSLSAQVISPYKLDKKDIWITAGSLGAAAISQLNLYSTPSLTENYIFNLDPIFTNSLDRFATQNYSRDMAIMSDFTTISSYFMAGSTALIPLLKNKKAGWDQVYSLAILGIQSNLITLTGTNLSKRTFLRTRPYVFNPNASLEEKLKPSARHSFFSGHTSLTAANCFFAAKVYSDYYPDSKWLPYVWGAAFGVPLLVAVQRVEAGKHYVTDVVVGYLFGAICGYYVPHLHKKKRVRGRHSEVYGIGRHSEVPPNAVSLKIMPAWGQDGKGIALQLSF